MITYKASDIVSRATQLADIENSDYISWNEKISLLNEAYVAIYQKLVDLNDNCIICSFETQEKIIPLTPDFWQLKAVLEIGNRGKYFPIMKRAPNESTDTNTYDLRNDAIIINGYPRTVRIEYYAVPKTLTFPCDKQKLYVNPIDMYKEFLLSTQDEYFCVQSIKDPSFNLETGLLATRYLPYYINSEWILFEDLEELKWTAYSLIDGNIVNFNYVPVVYKDALFYYDNEQLYFIDSATVALNIGPIDTTNIRFIIYEKGHTITHTIDDRVLVDNEEVPIKKPIKKLIYRNGEITGISNSNYFITIKNGRVQQSMSDYAILTAIDNNDNTGVGYLGKRFNEYFIISNLEDTILNFPNSFYFTMLAYKLAIAFKTKQGADTSQLLQLYTDAENTFSNTLTSDDWSVTRITNVY